MGGDESAAGTPVKKSLRAGCGERLAFNELGPHRIELEHATRNQAPCRVAEEAGICVSSGVLGK